MTSFTRRQVATHALAIASAFVGYNRSDNKHEISQWLELEGLPFADGSGTPYAYCISFAQYCQVKSFAQLSKVALNADDALTVLRSQKAAYSAFMKIDCSAACHVVVASAIEHGVWHAKASGYKPIAGDLQFYNWSGSMDPAHVEHVGIYKAGLADIEGNTSSSSNGNGGYVEARTRTTVPVVGWIGFGA